MHLGRADRVHEAQLGAQVVADIAPVVVRPVARRDGAGAVFALHPLDLTGDDVQRLVPADAFVAGDTTVLDVALAFGVEVHAFHRILDPVRRVDHRLPVHGVGRQHPLARGCELPAPRLDRPCPGIIRIERDRRRAQDFAVPNIDEQRTAIGHGAKPRRAVLHPAADPPARGQGRHHRLGKPQPVLVRPLEAHEEVLERVDLFALIDGGHQQACADRSCLEDERYGGCLMDARTRPDPAILEDQVAAGRAVLAANLHHQVALAQAGAKRRVAPCRDPEHPGQAPKDQLELHPYSPNDRAVAYSAV